MRKTVRKIVNKYWTGLLLFVLASTLIGQGRLRPPENVGCDRNELTSYTGVLNQFSKSKTHVTLTIRTDEATTEKVKVPNEKIGDHEPRKGERLTAWVCTSGAVTIQWLSPSPPR